MKLKIITWNINRASYEREKLWKYLNDLDFDIALLQEVCMIPYWIRKNCYVIRGELNAILFKRSLKIKPKEECIICSVPRSDAIMDFSVSAKIELEGRVLTFISVYNYMGPTETEFSEFLDILLNYLFTKKTQINIVGGDFNMDETFEGNYKKWGFLAKKMKKELHKRGYIEVLNLKLRENSFSFVSPVNRKPYQLDYLFIPKHSNISEIIVDNKDLVFSQESKLSDHLPIIVTLEL